MKKIFYRLLLVCAFAQSHVCTFAQDSSHLQISLLTCTPGEELYSTFGHSAFRVIDSSMASAESRDKVYNYGTFNFDEDFYLKFVRGKLLYFLSVQSFASFKDFYQFENRGITEQVLNLTPAEKITVQRFLDENSREENKFVNEMNPVRTCTHVIVQMRKRVKDDKIFFFMSVYASVTLRLSLSAE